TPRNPHCPVVWGARICLKYKPKIGGAPLGGATLFQQVKIPREFCFGPCQIGPKREEDTPA
ncbi:hypothetical protein NKH89_13695, partial [Mesorhizobium sp. M0923]|uniref:hypothetical protein n=1 Tax=Mesorhizobium sp. M0923 TaxID=2957028 RepID=UPI003338320C